MRHKTFVLGIMTGVTTYLLCACLMGCGRGKTEERGQGQLAPVQVIRRQLDERMAAEARFAALSPAEHLAAARAKVSDAEDSGTVDFDDATRHLVAIPSGAPERRSADALAREIARRVQRAREAENRARAAAERALIAQARQNRETYASQLDANFIHRGIEVDNVRVAGSDGTTLRIRYALCGRVFVDRFVSGNRAELAGLGFRRVECNSAFEQAWMDL